MSATVAIVGRANVGKSTLFNRLVGRRLALVDDTPGVTRDWRDGEGGIADLSFRLIDTAGFAGEDDRDLAARIAAQTDRALAGADVVLFLIDVRAGITPADAELAAAVRRLGKPVVLIANKCEGRLQQAALGEAYRLGLGDPLPFSAEHGEGLDLLYEALSEVLPPRPEIEPPLAAAPLPAAPLAATGEGGEAAAVDAPRPAAILRLAVVGRPNVGKSTLINRLIGDNRLLSGPQAGITREAIAIRWSFLGRTVELTDTPGLRRRSRIDDRLEALSSADSLRAIRSAHVVVLVVDAAAGVDRQDLTIARLAVEEGRAVVIVANKCDLPAASAARLAELRARLEDALSDLKGIRPLAVSAVTGRGLDRLLPEVVAAYDTWDTRVATNQLNIWLREVQAHHPPPRVGGGPVKIRYATQVRVRPPGFVLFLNRPVVLPDDYLRYLANSLRDRFGLDGVPLRLHTRHSGAGGRGERLAAGRRVR